jgi:two-component system CheB/CheR fusion protein
MNIPGFEEYLELIKDNETEQHIVFAELLIHVSSFFRDPGSFEYLYRAILPQVSRPAMEGDEQMRIWVAGCATGEEAYSIAICLYEIMGAELFAEKVKIFATDLSDGVIAKARKAVYPKTQMGGLSDARIKKFFREVEQGYEVVSYIRDVCVFASHNMLTDPPFAKLNLISCRNVLIYMQPVLQKKMLSIFNYALKDKGYLWLGKSETNRSPDLFEMPSKKTKVYLKKNVDKWTLRSAFPTNKKIKHMTPSFDQERNENVDAQKAADSIILSMFAPSAVLLNEQFDIVEFRGVTMQFFEHGPGKASLNILKLAHRDLVHSLRSALNQAQSSKRNIKKEGITISVVTGPLTVGFEIVPIINLHEVYYLVIFNHQVPEDFVGDGNVKKSEPTPDNTDDRTLRILQLDKEVQRYKDELRAVAEAYEATNEELQSANEELKSLNEELEVSQEELQVINDELSTRNNDLQERNNQLNNARLYSEAIVNTVHESLVILDANIRVVSANASFYRFFKIDRKETEGKIFYELGNKQWNNSDLRTLLENLLSSRAAFINYELTHKFNTIGERTMLLNGQLITSQDLKEDLILLAIEDISEVREARERIARKQEQVRVNEERLRLAMEGTKTGTWDFNPATWEILLSDRSRELFNIIGAAPVAYETFIKAIHPADVAIVTGSIQSALAGIDNGQINIDFRTTASDDSIRWISCKAQVFFEDRVANRVLGVVTDVTETKQFQRHLQDVNNRLHFALETGRLGSWELNIETGVLQCNELCKQNYGLAANTEVTIDRILQAIHSDDRDRVKQALDEAINTHTLFAEEYRIKNSDTAVRWVMARGQAVLDENTGIRHMIGITQDITERKQAQLHLQQSEAYFRMIADTAPAMIWIAEQSGSFSFFNKAWQKYTGRSLDQDKDKGWYDIMHPDDIEKWKINFSRSSRDRRNFYSEFRLRRQDGTYHWLSCSGIPRFAGEDEFVGFIGACVDIDDQKMVEDALERKVRERTIALEEANGNLSKRNHELEQFVFITSHDLQEPLRKIRLFADMLENVKPDSGAKIDTRLYLGKVKQSAIRMSDLIRDLISYSRLELGENAFLPVDLNQIVANVIEDFELLIREKQAQMEINDLPIIDAVPLQMNQLFYNLIGNALKFSTPGSSCRITISANKMTPADIAPYPHLNKNLSWYRIIVADNGIGFNQSYADKLFVIFQRLNQKEKFEGTGIGLALCRKIMDIHNGDIQAFGVEQQGAAFHIIIPEVQL